jgi:hypothetical protein
VLVGTAAWLELQKLPGSVLLFLVAAAGILAGLVGLGLDYFREKKRLEGEEDEPTAPRIHRKAVCQVDQPLLDKLARAVEVLRQRADEKHWEPDWNQYQEHAAAAGDLLQKGDRVGAFREYCRALLPLTRALQKQRNKEEVFQPVWDKPPH